MSTFRAPSLPVSPSLNRTPLLDVPGLPDGAAGVLAHDWLATWGMARRIADEPDAVAGIRALGHHLPELDAGPVSANLMTAAVAWPAGLDALLVAGSKARGYAVAERVAANIGAALGGLIVALVRGSGASRAARPEWPAERWERWAAVRRIALAGGSLRGELGRSIHTSALNMLALNDIHAGLRLAHPVEHLVLRGAAARIGMGVALDCGGTSLKAVRVASGEPAGQVRTSSAPGRVAAEEVIDAIAAAAAPLVAAHPAGDPVPVSVALATYVDKAGQPYADQLGCYAPLGEIDTPAALREAIERHTGRVVWLHLAHDGASALAGAQHHDPRIDAAIVLGTAIGHGLR